MQLRTRLIIIFSFLSLLGLGLIVAVIFSTWQEEHILQDLKELKKAVQLTSNKYMAEELIDIEKYSLYIQHENGTTVAVRKDIVIPDELLQQPYHLEYKEGSTEVNGNLYLWVVVPDIEKHEQYKAFYIEDDLSIREFYSIYGTPIIVIMVICLWAAIWAALIISTSYGKIQQQKKRLERQQEDIIDARKQAEEASIAKSTFLANMSHELRTPLNAIIGYCEMLQEDAADKDFENIEEDLTKVRTAADQLNGLISEILDLTKIEAGKMMISIETVDLDQLVNEVISVVQPMAKKRGNKLAVFYDRKHLEIHSDPVKLRQIIFNLISNACKFSEKGIVTLSINYVENEGKKHYQIVVSDEGIGLTEEQISQIFNPFVQVDSSVTRATGGTGLGLSITSRYVEMLGGTITVESRPDEGSRFIVMLPELAQSADEQKFVKVPG